MPKHYVWVEATVADREKMKPYGEKVGATVAKYGGRYIIRNGAFDILEGGAGEHKGKVLIEFPSREAALTWWNSPEYREISIIRQANSRGNFVLVEGKE